jgi:hypothetical protein
MVNQYVGKKIRRSILDSEGYAIGYSIGEISEWIPADKSGEGFLSERSGEPADLWRVKPIEYCLFEQGVAIRLGRARNYFKRQILMTFALDRYPPKSLGDEDLELEEIREALQTFAEVVGEICPEFTAKSHTRIICSQRLVAATYLIRKFLAGKNQP